MLYRPNLPSTGKYFRPARPTRHLTPSNAFTIKPCILASSCAAACRYPTLDKPSWTPPAPLFGQAWSVFYAVMGYASYLVWKQGSIEAQKRPLIFYGLQLAFNLSWPVTFFLRKKLGQAQIVNLGETVVTTRNCTRAAASQIPYQALTLLLHMLCVEPVAPLHNSTSAGNNDTQLFHMVLCPMTHSSISCRAHHLASMLESNLICRHTGLGICHCLGVL